MRLISVVLILFVSTSAFAETMTMPIEGMHCGGCTAAVEAKACGKDKGYKSCKAEITDAGKKMGQLVIETKRGEKINVDQVKTEVKATSYTPKEAKITN